MSRFSFSSYNYWSDDSDYATFNPTTTFDAPILQVEKKATPERRFTHMNIVRDPEEEPVYENLGNKCSATVVLYGQILRSALNNSKGKKHKKVINGIVELFQLTTPEWNSERLASIVESKLDRMMEADVGKFRQTAEKMSRLLQDGNRKKLPKFNSFKQKLRSIFIN